MDQLKTYRGLICFCRQVTVSVSATPSSSGISTSPAHQVTMDQLLLRLPQTSDSELPHSCGPKWTLQPITSPVCLERCRIKYPSHYPVHSYVCFVHGVQETVHIGWQRYPSTLASSEASVWFQCFPSTKGRNTTGTHAHDTDKTPYDCQTCPGNL